MSKILNKNILEIYETIFHHPQFPSYSNPDLIVALQDTPLLFPSANMFCSMGPLIWVRYLSHINHCCQPNSPVDRGFYLCTKRTFLRHTSNMHVSPRVFHVCEPAIPSRPTCLITLSPWQRRNHYDLLMPYIWSSTSVNFISHPDSPA